LSDYQLLNMRSYLKGQSFNYTEDAKMDQVSSSLVRDAFTGPSGIFCRISN